MFSVRKRLLRNGKATSISMFVLLLMSTLAFAFNTRLVNANEIVVPGKYPSIQAAINAADPGDTILVKTGTYYEQVVLNKTILLIGENKENTIINGYNAEEKGNVITVEANGALIENFTIMNSGIYGSDAGISVGGCNDTIVRNNKITNCMWGIYIWSSWLGDNSFNTTLLGNEVYGSNVWGGGIQLSYCFNCTLRNNRMAGNADDFVVNGNEVSHFVHDIDPSNIVEGSRVTYYLINQHDITINPSAYPNAGFLALVNSTNIKVESMELGNCEPGLLFAFTNNSLITGNNVSSCRSAIDLLHSSNNTVVGNYLGPDNHDSIVLEKTSNDNTIDGNTILENQGDGIQISESDGNKVTRNTISNTTEGNGINIRDSFGETLIGNNISAARYGNGILLDYSSGCKLRNNRMNLNGYDFGVTGDNASHFDHDIDQSNLVEDKILYYISDQHNVILDPSTLPQVGFLGLMHSTNVTVQNMDIFGLVLAFTEDSVITGNTISYCQEGMLLVHSSNNTITGNTASYNGKNVHLSFSSGNTISENTFTDSNIYEAILLDTLSDNNKLTGNILTNNSNGIKLSNSSNNIIIGNTIWNTSWHSYGNGIETWDESNNNTISRNIISDNADTGIRILSSSNTVTENVLIGNGWGGYSFDPIYAGDGISLDGTYDYETACQNNTVSGNTIANTYGNGISLWAPSHNTITRNTITNSTGEDGGIWGIVVNNTEIIGNSITNNKNDGISLYYCFYNNISENYIANNGNYGISFDDNSSNFIYHNNFINNTLHVLSTGDSNNTWDDGYPSGGNYWSGYNDTDLQSGPYQNQLGNDSIWDHPYVISSLESDRYPLVNPWPNSRCTIHFYTNPASPSSNIDFEGQTYGNGDTRTCIYGTSGLVTANPPEGYVFDHWEAEGNVRVSNDRDNPAYIAINCGGNLTAVFSQTPLPVQITFQASGISGDTSGTALTIDGTNYTYSQLPQTYTWNVGSKHTIIASNSISAGSDKRYLWTGWTNGDGLISRSGTYSVPSSNQTVTANYNAQYYITVQTYPSEGGYVSPISGWRNAGSTIEIEATTNNGYAFDSWSGSGLGSYTGPNNPIPVTIDGPITEIANFKAVQIGEFSGAPYLALSVLAVVGTAVILNAQTKRQRLRKKD